jgi:hypothetical protein
MREKRRSHLVVMWSCHENQRPFNRYFMRPSRTNLTEEEVDDPFEEKDG